MKTSTHGKRSVRAALGSNADHAAHQADDGARFVALDRSECSQFADGFFFSALTYHAGIDDDHIGVFARSAG